MVDVADDVLGLYLRDLDEVPMLDVATVRHLVRRAQGGDVAARNQVVEAHLRLVVFTVKKYRRSSVPLPDCIQAGNLGLMRAVMGWKPDGGMSFLNYAIRWIRNYMERGAEHYALPFSMPAHMVAWMAQVRRAVAQLCACNESLDDDRICALARLSRAQLRLVRLAGVGCVSLDALVDDESEMTLGSVLPAPEMDMTLPVTLASGVERLPCWWDLTERERFIILHHYGLGADEICWSQERLAKHFGLTRERIRVIERNAFARLRAALLGLEAQVPA